MLALTEHVHVATAGTQNFNLIPTDGSIFDLLFHRTRMTLQVLGWPNPPFSINLIQLIIILMLAFAINGATERLTGRRVGMWTAVFLTLIGSWLFSNYVNLPIDFSIEGVRIIAAILGALVVAVFYTLIVGKK